MPLGAYRCYPDLPRTPPRYALPTASNKAGKLQNRRGELKRRRMFSAMHLKCPNWDMSNINNLARTETPWDSDFPANGTTTTWTRPLRHSSSNQTREGFGPLSTFPLLALTPPQPPLPHCSFPDPCYHLFYERY